ncbi:hypothetical protein U1Q18_035752, partial [Sarracenia purpurea var. burkii]
CHDGGLCPGPPELGYCQRYSDGCGGSAYCDLLRRPQTHLGELRQRNGGGSEAASKLGEVVVALWWG